MNPDVPDELRKQLAELSDYEPFQQEMEAKHAHDMEVMKNIMGCIMRSVDKVGIDTTYQLVKNALEGDVIHPPVEDYIKYVQHREL
ncbi:MAG: hypothetical protein J6Y02_14705 [Pseudobutyrivibrio sp.]|nr:hypothetical protein [Pseudobutyrivibrio sp.]